MDDLTKDLEKLAIISKLRTELENHVGVNDSNLAKFILHLAEENRTIDSFRKAVSKNGGEEFTEKFVANLFRIIQNMWLKNVAEDKKVKVKSNVDDSFTKSKHIF